MQRLTAWLIGVWLGMQIGFVCGVSPIVFTSHLIHKNLATQLVGKLFDVANLIGLLVWLLAFLSYRPAPRYWGQSPTHFLYRVRVWIGVLCLSLLGGLSVNHAMLHYPDHILPQYLGGGWGFWRGGAHSWQLWITLLGMGLCGRLLHLDNQR